MELVEPIRDKNKIEAIKKILRAESERNYLLFIMGINSALRISDLLKLTFADVTDRHGRAAERFRGKEQKTTKNKNAIFPASVKKALDAYIKKHDGIDLETPLFYSRKKKDGKLQPITRQMAYMIIKNAADIVGLENIGTHTMRKTWGYHAYKMGVDITIIQETLNHSAPSVTLRYIGITQDDIDNVMLKMDL